MFKTPEYAHLLDAERILHESLSEADPPFRAGIAAALVKVIDLKRVLRGVPAPRAAEFVGGKPVATTNKRGRGLKIVQAPGTDVAAPVEPPANPGQVA